SLARECDRFRIVAPDIGGVGGDPIKDRSEWTARRQPQRAVGGLCALAPVPAPGQHQAATAVRERKTRVEPQCGFERVERVGDAAKTGVNEGAPEMSPGILI